MVRISGASWTLYDWITPGALNASPARWISVGHEIARRMRQDSHLVLFGLDSACAHHLERQFAQDRRVNVIHGDAARAAIC